MGLVVASIGLALGLLLFSVGLNRDSFDWLLLGVLLMFVGGVAGLSLAVCEIVRQRRAGASTSMAKAGVGASILSLALAVLAFLLVGWLVAGIVGPDGGILA